MKLSSIDSIEWWDDDPWFRKVILYLNELGYKTSSSCAGHAPGEQYEEVNVWMEPYITFDKNYEIITQLIDQRFVHKTNEKIPVYVEFNRNVDWSEVYGFIKDKHVTR